MRQTLAQVTGLGGVWLNAAVPEAQSASVRIGQSATATLTAFPGERFTGRIIAVLPTTQADSRTLTVRIELPNRGGRLRPGMFAQVALGGMAATFITAFVWHASWPDLIVGLAFAVMNADAARQMWDAAREERGPHVLSDTGPSRTKDACRQGHADQDVPLLRRRQKSAGKP